MYKRRVNLREAYNKRVLNEPSKTLPKQEEITKKIIKFAEEKDTRDVVGYGLHNHICTFEMISNDRGWQKTQCKKWLKKHPIISKNIIDSSDYCDYCAMFNYVALDDEGKVMYVSRTFPQEIYEWEKKYYENNNS